MAGSQTSWDVETQPHADSAPQASPELPADSAPQASPEWQARLARAYLSGNGAEVERVLALIAEADYTLPPKTSHAA